MDLKEIKSVIDLMTKNGLSEFELEKDDFKIRVKRGNSGEAGSILVTPALQSMPAMVSSVLHPQTAPVAGGHALPTIPEPGAALASDTKTYIVSPMVGTFYTAPSPDSEPYIAIGQKVTSETVVCIIEAMKVMNEIKAEVEGVITEIIAPNGKPVEFGKPLFAIKPS
jgi:acetyl-CoA carboxylase biotin carboxyl carrier protein